MFLLKEKKIMQFLKNISYNNDIVINDDIEKYILKFAEYEYTKKERFDYSDCALLQYIVLWHISIPKRLSENNR